MVAPAELAADRRAHVAHYARGALLAADALGRIPTPLEDVTAALQLASPLDLFDLGDVPPGLGQRLRRLAGKVLGIFAVRERVIYLDHTQHPAQRRFTHGHEAGHRGLPWHDDAYYCDDHRTLDPDTHAELEAEASVFSAELLFNLDAFTDRAHATAPGLAPALQLADVFDTSRHAAIRRYVEASPRPCALLVLGRFLVYPDGRRSLKVLRGLESVTFRDRYGPITSCLPATLPVDELPLARDALTALRGQAATPVLAGSVTTIDSRRGAVQLDYEVYSNAYQAFVLLLPRHRVTLTRPVRALWRP
jgi:hypothetical protein